MTLRAEDWDAPAPECPRCAASVRQEFKPFAIGGSARARATALAEDIVANDYHVADMTADNRDGGTPKVRYQDIKPETLPGVTRASLQDASKALANAPPAVPSRWGGVSHDAMQTAIALGRDTRMRHGNGLDVLHAALKSGAQPDLIEVSKKRSMRIW